MEFVKCNRRDINGNNERPTYISLGHEMAHIQDIWRGSYDGSTWFVSDDDKVNVPNAEKYATHVENQIRAEHKLPLRAYYTSKKYSKASLLFPKTRASRFYKEVKRLGNVLIPTTPYIY